MSEFKLFARCELDHFRRVCEKFPGLYDNTRQWSVDHLDDDTEGEIVCCVVEWPQDNGMDLARALEIAGAIGQTPSGTVQLEVRTDNHRAVMCLYPGNPLPDTRFRFDRRALHGEMSKRMERIRMLTYE